MNVHPIIRDGGVRPVRFFALLILVIVILRGASPSDSNQFLLTLMCVNAIAALGLNIILGMAGLLSLAQASLSAVGGYTAGILLVQHQVSFWLAALVAIIVAGLVSMIAGLIATRVRSHYFILVTLGIAGTVNLVLVNDVSLTGGSNGLIGIPPMSVLGKTVSSTWGILVAALVVLFLLWYLAEALKQSREGRAMIGVGANEPLALACGVNPLRSRFLASWVGGMYAGIAGVLLAEALQFLGPDDFGLDQALLLLLIVAVGGMGSNLGTVIAAIIVTYLSSGLLTLTSVGTLVYGLGIMVVLLIAPGGLVGVGRRLLSLADHLVGSRLAWRK